MKRNEKVLIIGSVILALSVVLVTLIVVFTKSSDDNSEPSTNPPITDPDDIPLPYSSALIVKINDSALWARDINSDSSTFLIKNWTKHFRSFDFYLKSNIYFGSTVAGEAITSYSKQFPQLEQPGSWSSNQIAVDNVHGKVYVIDGLAAKINVFDIWNEHYNIISIDLNQPRDIAIDPAVKCMFVLQLSSILKANLDGTSPKTIVQRTDIAAFAIDVDEKRVYWATIYDIQSVDYTGQKGNVVEIISNPVTSLAVLNNSLFWLNPANDYETPLLWSCKIVKGVCVDVSSIAFDDNAVELKAYNFNKLDISDPCKSMSKCEQMCVNSIDKPRCECSIGLQLKNDSQSCETIDEYLLYVQGDFVKGRVLDFSKDAFVAAILPVKLNISSLIRKQVVDFDFDARAHELVFNDDNIMSKINLKPGSKQVSFGGDSKDSFENLAIDWVTRNVYYLKKYFWSDYMNVAVRNIDPYDSSTAQNVINAIVDPKYSNSLAVHPNRGYLFYTLFDYGDKNMIHIARTNLDGTERTYLGGNLSISIKDNGLTIDYEEDRLFWFNKDKKQVHSVDLDCLNLKAIDISMVENAATINVFEKWIYISNSKSVWRFDKKTGQNFTKVLPMFEDGSQPIRSAKVFSQKSQLIDSDHPCAINNGGCKRYCFAKPKVNGSKQLERVCGCNGNESLDSDGKNCIKFREAQNTTESL